MCHLVLGTLVFIHRIKTCVKSFPGGEGGEEERDAEEMRGLTVPCYLVSWAVQAQIWSPEINSFPSLTPASPPLPTELCSLRGRGMTNSNRGQAWLDSQEKLLSSWVQRQT